MTVTACAPLPAIVDYHPAEFMEEPTAPFFFSIGDDLRFGRSIVETTSILFSGELTAVYPSPDDKKAAIVSGGRLYIAEPGHPTKLLLTEVDNYYTKNSYLGETFYEYPTLQWDERSGSLYIILAVKDNSPSQIYPRSATLVRIDPTEPGHVIDVVQNFRSLHYFLVGDNAVCFDYATGTGDVIWKCARNGAILLPKGVKDNQVLLEDGTTIKGKPFLSYHPNIYESDIWLTLYGFSLRLTKNQKMGFFSKS